MTAKVFVLGIDGLSPSFLKQLIDEGRLPNFSDLMNNGISGILKSTIPPLSVPAWPSICTGLNPGNHGMYGFITKKRENSEYVIHDSESLKGKAVWDQLGEHGKRSILVNIPLTYPPYPVNGVMVSGFPAPQNRLTAFPSSIQNELRELFPDYRIDNDYFAGTPEELDREQFLSEIDRLLDVRTQVAKYLMKRYPWDLFFMVYTESDRFQHVFWPYSDPVYPFDLPEKDRYGDAMSSFYCKLDDHLGVLRENLDDDTYLLIVSDHGFESIHRRFAVNNWLQSEGLTKRKSPQVSRYRVLKPLYGWLVNRTSLDPNKLFSVLPRFLRNLLVNDDLIQGGTGGIQLGNIEERGLSVDVLKDMLLDIKDPKTGQNVIHSVYSRDEIYSGEFVGDTYDLILVPYSGYLVVKWNDSSVFVDYLKHGGNHTGIDAMDGTVILSGPGITGREVECSVVDVVPTIYSLLGIEYEEHFDGAAII